jgi:hypothetical protein
MAMKIWKFRLELTDTQQLQLPKGAEILSVQVQASIICMWALCDDNANIVDRRINIYGTGHKLPENSHIGEFIATVQLAGGDLVFHVFDAG